MGNPFGVCQVEEPEGRLEGCADVGHGIC